MSERVKDRNSRAVWPRWLRRLVVISAALAALVIVARWPVTTRAGYNYKVSVRQWTLLEKAVAFVDRDFQLRRLSEQIAGTGGTQEQRLLRMYDWVTANLGFVPEGFPVIDDHVLNIFIRQYGTQDQRAEALAVLASYDGMPGSTIPLGKGPKRRPIQLTVVKLDTRLVLFDVNNNIVFRRPSGELATVKDVVADPAIVKAAGRGLIVDDAPYEEHFARLGDVEVTFARMEKQRFWPRLWNETLGWLQKIGTRGAR